MYYIWPDVKFLSEVSDAKKICGISYVCDDDGEC